MYYKIINNRQVFDTCRTIKMSDGSWVSNPSEEQILAEGWLPYEPPEIVPEPLMEPDFMDVVLAVKKILSKESETLSDEEALEVAALYPTWISMIGKEVTVGQRYWYDGDLYKVVQTHTVQENWTPNTVPALFTKVSIVEIPDWVQPSGAQDAYNTGDKVKHNGKTWESNTDNNVWEPGTYGWDEIV